LVLHLFRKGTLSLAEPNNPDGPSSSDDSETGILPGGKARVSSVVGLSLLEVIRALDLPTEVLAAEDPTQTMPRRLGLSEVVDHQIRLFREQVRKRGKITDREAQALFHLVLRRPDSEEAFFQAGELLTSDAKPPRGLSRLSSDKGLFTLSRRQVRKRIRTLFGRHIGGFAHGAFNLEAKGHFLLDLDPGGDACALVTGLSQAVLSRNLRRPVKVTHTSCEARKQELCRWVVSDSD
jgi:hypothetical protein